MRRTLSLLLVTVVALGSCAFNEDDDPGVLRSGSSPSSSPAPSLSEGVVKGPDLAFAVIGDWGSGLDEEFEVANRMCRWHRKRPFDLVVTTGDNIYPDGDPEDFETKFFEPHACLLDADVPWHASLGNHDIVTDGGRPELSEPAFGMPKKNYVIRRAGVRFVMADSNALKMRWLRRATRAEEGDRWTVAVFHHPVFSAGTSHGPTHGLDDKLLGLFNRRGVDLVLNGHDHVYSVTKPISGTRYVVTGGGGASIGGCRKAIQVVRCAARHHFLYVAASSEELNVYAVPVRGRPFHHFSTTGI